MAMVAPIPMPIDAGLLTLAQWLSPAYPVGGFAYSHGLEALVASGDIATAAQFEEWLRDVLTYGAGRNDTILLAAAYNATDAEALAEIDTLARALAPSRERALEAELQGTAFAQTTDAIWDTQLGPLVLPVAVGAAAARENLPLADTLPLYLQAFASNLTAAATRLVPLGQTDAQRALANCADVLADLAELALNSTVEDLGASAFLTDIASMRHETQYSRIFRS